MTEPRRVMEGPFPMPRPQETLGWEAPGDDFPFYRGLPVTIDGKGWARILSLLILGLLCLMMGYFPSLPYWLESYALALLLPAAAILGLRWGAGPGAVRALFRRPRLRDLGTLAFFLVLSIASSMLLTQVADYLTAADAPLNSNPAAMAQDETFYQPPLDPLDPEGEWVESSFGIGEFLLMRGAEVFQLMGEELLGVLPMLWMLWWFTKKGMPRIHAVWVSWVLSSLLFGVWHLPTYDFHLLQSLVVIGVGRMVDTAAYIKTKNLWMSYAVHLLFDWFVFVMVFFG